MSKKEHCKGQKNDPCCCGEEKAPVESAASEPDTTIEVRLSEYQALQEQAKDSKDKYLRILAEFENVRKRNERDRMEFVKYANEGLISEFLYVLDDLERSVETARAKHQDYDSFIHGVEMVMKRVYALLKKQGAEPIEAVGKMFDPHMHEILMQTPSQEQENGMVIQELQKGYRIGDRVLRTAKVGVVVNVSPDESGNSAELDQNSVEPEEGSVQE